MEHCKLTPSKDTLQGLWLGIAVAVGLLMVAVLLCGLQRMIPARAEPMMPSAMDDTAISSSEPYTVGAVLALTGGGSSLGVPEANTIEMLEDQINAQGGINGHPLHVIISDTQSNPAVARDLVSSLISNHDVFAIIGPSLSGTSLNVLDIVGQAQVPLISLASTSSIVEPVSYRRWVFKTPLANDAVAARQLDYLLCYGLDEVAVMYENTGYGEDGLYQFSVQAPAAGVTVVITETFSREDTNFEPQLTRIAASPAEALVFWGLSTQASAIAVQANGMSLGMPILLNSGSCDQGFIDGVGEAANGVLAVCEKIMVADNLPDSDPQKAVILKYVADYTDTYGVGASPFGGYAWDATVLISDALGAAGGDGADIRHDIESTTGFAGIGGVYNFSCVDHNGLTKRNLVIAEVADDTWRLATMCEPRVYLPLTLKNFEPRPLSWIDVHTHIDPEVCCGDVCGADLLVAGMKAAGVSKFVLFPLAGSSDSDDVLAAYYKYPDHIIPFRGPDGLALGDPSSLDLIREDLDTGLFWGLGEILTRHGFYRIEIPATHTVMLDLWDLAAEYDIPVNVHMGTRPSGEDQTDIPAEWLAELEEALDQSPSTTFIWAHSGPSRPDVLRGMLERHPNLYADLSALCLVFHEMKGREPWPELLIDGPEWIQLLEDHSDRFLFGTDVYFLEAYVNPAAIMAYVRDEVFSQLSDEAVDAISHENAERLIGISLSP